MIGYAILVLVALLTVILGSIVVGVAIWGWGQQKKAKLAAAVQAKVNSGPLSFEVAPQGTASQK